MKCKDKSDMTRCVMIAETNLTCFIIQHVALYIIADVFLISIDITEIQQSLY